MTKRESPILNESILYPLVLLTLTLLFLFPGKMLRTPADGGWYLSLALNLAKGQGYKDVDGSPVVLRGPIFPLWLAFFMKLFGTNLPAAFLASRFFYPVYILFIYVIGAKLFSKKVGLLAALLALTSLSLSRWSLFIHLDHVFPAFVLLYAWLVLCAVERNSLLYFVLSGFVLGIAYLLKETAVLFLPLPLLLAWMPSPHRLGNRSSVVKAAIAAGAFFFTVSPWLMYTYSLTGSASLLGKGVGSDVARTLIEQLQAHGLLAIPNGLMGYYQVY